MRGNNKIRLAITVLLPAIWIVSCGSKLTQENLLGYWEEVGDALTIQPTAEVGSFEFFSDGRFIAKFIPQEYFLFSGSASKRIDASGTWEIASSRSSPPAADRVKIIFESTRGFPRGFMSFLLITTDGKALFRGTEGARLIFVKVGNN